MDWRRRRNGLTNPLCYHGYIMYTSILHVYAIALSSPYEVLVNVFFQYCEIIAKLVTFFSFLWHTMDGLTSIDGVFFVFGFPSKSTDRISTRCYLQISVKNHRYTNVTYRHIQWKVKHVSWACIVITFYHSIYYFTQRFRYSNFGFYRYFHLPFRELRQW